MGVFQLMRLEQTAVISAGACACSAPFLSVFAFVPPRLVAIVMSDRAAVKWKRFPGPKACCIRLDALEVAIRASPEARLRAVYDWARFNSLPRGYGWIRRELDKKRVEPAELVDMTLRYGDIGTMRRVGVLLAARARGLGREAAAQAAEEAAAVHRLDSVDTDVVQAR